MPLPFIKMHGIGNDFVIFDARRSPVKLNKPQLAKIAARRMGIGCDQVIVVETSRKADAFMRIYNCDGSEVDSCGNATRCVAWLVMKETGKDAATVETRAGLLVCERADNRRIRADMGQPRFGWKDIPLAEECDTLHLPIHFSSPSQGEGLSDPAAVSMGNPHMIFVVKNADAISVDEVGPRLERHPLFPEGANVSFAQVVSGSEVKLRVWERVSGETLGCGTAACAALAALHRRGLAGRSAKVALPGGLLEVSWDEKTDHVLMTGPVAVSFHGEIEP